MKVLPQFYTPLVFLLFSYYSSDVQMLRGTKRKRVQKIEEWKDKWKENQNYSLPQTSKEGTGLFGQPSSIATYTIFFAIDWDPQYGILKAALCIITLGVVRGGLNLPLLFLPAPYCFSRSIKIVCIHLAFIIFLLWGWRVCFIIPYLSPLLNTLHWIVFSS